MNQVRRRRPSHYRAKPAIAQPSLTYAQVAAAFNAMHPDQPRLSRAGAEKTANRALRKLRRMLTTEIF